MKADVLNRLVVAAALALCPNVVAQVPAGVISWWTGDGNATDVVGTNNGTLNGVTFAPGEKGQAFDIAPGSYVAIPDAPELNPTNAITIEAWIYRRAEVGPSDAIVKKAGPADGSYSLECSGNQLCLSVYIGGWQGCCAGSVPFNQWCHVAGTYDGSTISVYVNGVLVGAGGASGQMTPSHNPINFGRDPSGNGREYSGLIDEVRIYNRALSQLEIYAVFSGLPPPTTMPSTGPIVPELAPLQQVMTNAMLNHQVNAASLALMKNSRLVFRQGYGWANKQASAVTHPDNLFRLASVCKPLTASAIIKLINEGAISNSMPVYAYLGIRPWGGVLADSRITNITVAELLNHSGGWNTQISPVGEFSSLMVSQQMGLSYPAAPTNVISWSFGTRPLDFAPGTSNVYCNFGYEVLGRVIEKASGRPYVDYIQNVLLGSSVTLNPIGFTNLVQSRSRPTDLAPWEIWYDNPGGWGQCVADYPRNISSAAADGAWYYFESFDSFGGLSASAIGLCSYLRNYWEGGDRRYPGEYYGWGYSFFGGLPGASTVLYQGINENPSSTNGLEFAALFNGGRGPGGPSDDAFAGLQNAATNITSWPTNGGGEVQWETPATNTLENAGSVSVRLVRGGLSTLPVKVSYTTYPVTATASNFSSVSGIAAFSPGQTNLTISVPILDTGHAVPYKQFLLELLSASGGCWLGSNLSCVLSIEGTNKTPYFTTQPQDQTSVVGATARFIATAQGVPPLRYQWRKNGLPVPNATDSAYALAPLQSSDAGNYDLVVRSGFGSVTSTVAVLTVAGFKPSCAAAPPAGLISWWPGDGTAGDCVGTNTGALQNGVTYGPGQAGEAFFFDGISGYMLVTGSGYMTGARTMEAWIFPRSHEGYGMPIATTGIPWQGDLFGVAGTGGCGGTGGVYIDHWGTGCLHTALRVVMNTWNHVAFTYDGTTIYFYVNGLASAPITESLYDFDLSTLTIGCNLIGGSSTQPSFDGGIDEFRIYNRALTPWEIQAIYAAGTNGMCPPAPMMLSGAGAASRTNGFVLSASLRSGRNYYLQATANLAPANWTTLTNFTAESAPMFSYTDTGAANLPKRFYRLVSLEGATTPPYFLTQPESQTALLGATAMFQATAQGALPIQYQWRKNGVPIPGATSSEYELATLRTLDAGNYDAVARNSCGTVTSLVAVLTIAGASQTNCAICAPSGLLSWWTGDDTIADRVGTNSAVLQNGVIYQPGEVGDSFFFDGITGCVLVNGSGHISGPRTIEAWVYSHAPSGWYGLPIATTGISGQGDMFGIAGGNTGCGGTGGVYIDHWGTGCLNSGLQVVTNTWTHVAFTYDGTTVRFFVNGVPSAPITQSLYDFDLSSLTIGGQLIGASTTQPSFDGGIDEFRIYNRALASSEIQAIYVAGTNGMCPPSPIVFTGAGSFSKINGFVLNVSLRSGQSYRIQASTNLFTTNWTTLTSFAAGTAPVFSYTNKSATSLVQQFYRVVSP